MRLSRIQKIIFWLMVAIIGLCAFWIVTDEHVINQDLNLKSRYLKLTDEFKSLLITAKDNDNVMHEMYGMIQVLRDYAGLDSGKLERYVDLIQSAIADLKRFGSQKTVIPVIITGENEGSADYYEELPCLNQLSEN